jgi:proteasome lid subunit RPN8/RPN11
MKPETKAAAEQHAEKEYPREACGLVVIVKGKERYFPCRNIATEEMSFVMEPRDYAAADDAGAITAVVHSHPNMKPKASMADRAAMEASGLPWHIVGWPTGLWASYKPEGWQPPLIGREWCYGTLDCYALARDWYKQEWGLELSDYERHGEWWHKGMNTFVENFGKEDFVSVGQDAEPQYGDALLMQIVSPVSNHVAIYIGDDLILQHLERRLSSRDLWSGYYRKNTTHILRHRSRL